MKFKQLKSAMLSFLLCTVCFAGCSKASATSLPSAEIDSLSGRTGGYVEEEISPDHFNLLGLFWVNGALNYFSVENIMDPLPEWRVHWYTLNQDDTWTERTDHGFAEVAANAPEKVSMVKPYLAKDGTLYWQLLKESGGIGFDASLPWSRNEVYFAVKDGTVQKISTLPEGEVSLFFDSETIQLVPCGDVLLRSTNSMELNFWDVQGNALNIETPALNDRLLCGNQNGYYVYDSQNDLLGHYTVGGTTSEIVLDGSQFSLTDPDCSLGGAAVSDDDTLYIAVRKGTRLDSSSTRLFRYRWDSELAPKDNGTLTVFSLHPSETITAAAQMLQKKTGVTVKYHYALEDDIDYGFTSPAAEQEGITVNDVLTQLNTQLLSGTGPDVLILDGLPTDSLIEKNMLLNLDGLIFTEDLLPNLAAVCKTDEGLFALPGRCHPLLVTGSEEELCLVTTAEETARALCKEDTVFGRAVDWKSGKLPLFAYQTTADVFNHFYPLYASRIWQDGVLNESAYREFVALVGDIFSSSGSDLMDFPLDQNIRSYYKLYSGSSSAYTNRLCRANCDFFMSPEQFVSNYNPSMREQFQNPGVCEAKPFLSESGASCVYSTLVAGVNAASQNPEMAVRFIELLLSDEIQSANHFEGFPVRISSLQNVWQQSLLQSEVTSHTDIVSLVQSLDVVPRNEFLRTAAAKGMMAWQKTHSVDDAVEAAQNAVKLWLAEQ